MENMEYYRFLNAARALILLDVLRLFRLRVSRNRKFYAHGHPEEEGSSLLDFNNGLMGQKIQKLKNGTEYHFLIFVFFYNVSPHNNLFHIPVGQKDTICYV